MIIHSKCTFIYTYLGIKSQLLLLTCTSLSIQSGVNYVVWLLILAIQKISNPTLFFLNYYYYFGEIPFLPHCDPNGSDSTDVLKTRSPLRAVQTASMISFSFLTNMVKRWMRKLSLASCPLSPGTLTL